MGITPVEVLIGISPVEVLLGITPVEVLIGIRPVEILTGINPVEVLIMMVLQSHNSVLYLTLFLMQIVPLQCGLLFMQFY